MSTLTQVDMAYCTSDSEMITSECFTDAVEQGTLTLNHACDPCTRQEKVALGNSKSHTHGSVHELVPKVKKLRRFKKDVPTVSPNFAFDNAFLCSTNRLMLSKASIGSNTCTVLWDSGASSDFMSQRVATRMKLKLRKLKYKGYVTTAGGHAVPCVSFVRVWVTLGNGRFRICLKVVDMVPDLILGIGFMRNFRFNMDWDQNIVNLDYGVTVPLDYKNESTPPPGLLWKEGAPMRHSNKDPTAIPTLDPAIHLLTEQCEQLDSLDISYGSITKCLKQ